MDSKMCNNKDFDIVYLGIEKDDFVPVVKDNCLTDLFKTEICWEVVLCGIIEFNFSNNKNENTERI
jgi:hypothetical protein